jgi:hypothetical protein
LDRLCEHEKELLQETMPLFALVTATLLDYSII